MFALTVFYHILVAYQRLFRGEAQCACGHGEHVFAVQGINGDIGCQAGFQLQVRIVGGDHYFVSDYSGRRTARAGAACVSQSDLRDRSFEYVVRVGIYGECSPLSFFHTAYVGFIHIGHNLHLSQVGGNGE